MNPDDFDSFSFGHWNTHKYTLSLVLDYMDDFQHWKMLLFEKNIEHFCVGPCSTMYYVNFKKIFVNM